MGDLIEQLRQWSPLELAAVTSALLYLVLAIRQNIFCWMFAGISTAIYVYLFVVAQLYMESALNVFYFLLDTRTDAAFPYIDSLTTWSAIWATFLVARKVLENWWYWLVIDVASVFIYWSRGLELTALLFVVYVIMIPFGLISWTRSYREAST
jgi:nicotinamide mononucleotide transporter